MTARDIRPEDARGDEMKGELLIAEDDTMPGVAAALVAHDVVGLAGQLVDDLALALVAPLGADHRHHAHSAMSFPILCSGGLAPLHTGQDRRVGDLLDRRAVVGEDQPILLRLRRLDDIQHIRRDRPDQRVRRLLRQIRS